MNKRRKIVVTTLITAGLFSAVFIAANPGSADDPLISKSYIESVLMPQIKSVSSFQVVSLSEGKTLIGGEGCEMIVRTGSGIIIASQRGGISDTTEGADLANGTAAPLNHLLIVPLPDGRGIEAKSDMLIMVKGEYSIK